MDIKNYAKGYPLEEGDVFRLGRLRFRVREVYLGKNNKEKVEHDVERIRCGKHFGGGKDVTHIKKEGEETEESNPYLLCRICLEGEKDDMKEVGGYK